MAVYRPDLDAAVSVGLLPDELLRLQEISTLLIQERELDSLYSRILDAAVDLMASDMASIQEFEPNRNELHLLASKGFHPQSAVFWEWVRLDSGSSCAAALSEGRRIIVPDVEASEFIGGDDADEYRRSGIRGVQSTPLRSRSGQLLGMISTHWREVHRPAERALRALDVLARQAADLIDRSKSELRLRQSEAGLKAAVDLLALGLYSWNPQTNELQGTTR
ncbi:GAF domain-containing protein [Bradyrhizobium sp. USDA 4471]